MAKKKSSGFWIGLALVLIAVLSFLQFGILQGYADDLLPLAALGAGIYMLVKE